MKDFAQWLASYMKDNKITQYKLQKMGIPQSTVNGILREGKSPTERTQKKIREALGVSMAEFDDRPDLDRAFSVADKMNLDPQRKEALQKIKALPAEEQQARLDAAIEQYKSLSPEAREALAVVIRKMAASER